MRVFVAGATGAIGTRLVPQLVERGHEVIGTSRSTDKAERLRAQGAEPVVVDLLDAGAVQEAVAAARPDAIVHQGTALAGMSDIKHFDRSFAMTNRLRTEGTDALLAAARETGVGRIVAQSFAGWPYAREGGPVKTEEDPLDPTPVPAMRETLTAMRQLEQTVVDAGGLALRYGGLYGSPQDVQLELVLKRGEPGIYNIVDDEPAPVREWLPALAAAIGAKPPRRVPGWLGRLLAGEVGVVLMTEIRGASNAKAKRELGWRLRYPSWRRGFVDAYSSTICSRGLGP